VFKTSVQCRQRRSDDRSSCPHNAHRAYRRRASRGWGTNSLVDISKARYESSAHPPRERCIRPVPARQFTCIWRRPHGSTRLLLDHPVVRRHACLQLDVTELGRRQRIPARCAAEYSRCASIIAIECNYTKSCIDSCDSRHGSWNVYASMYAIWTDRS